MTTLALAVVAVAWLIQLLHSWSGHKNIHVYFVLAFALGTALSIVENYQVSGGMTTDMWFYVASFVFALLVFLKVRNK